MIRFGPFQVYTFPWFVSMTMPNFVDLFSQSGGVCVGKKPECSIGASLAPLNHRIHLQISKQFCKYMFHTLKLNTTTIKISLGVFENLSLSQLLFHKKSFETFPNGFKELH
jgi:hypothetical protein